MPVYLFMHNELKIVVAGPPRSGKTELVDLLSAASKGFQGRPYQATVGVRIQECATQIEVNGLQANISVQLWDTSGDEKFQACWPAICKDADGIMIVYDALDDVSGRAVAGYARGFTPGFEPVQVLIVANRMSQSTAKAARPKLIRSLEHALVVIINTSEELSELNAHFAEFLAQIYTLRVRRIEEAEKRLVGTPQPSKPARGRAKGDAPAKEEGGDS